MDVSLHGAAGMSRHPGPMMDKATDDLTTWMWIPTPVLTCVANDALLEYLDPFIENLDSTIFELQDIIANVESFWKAKRPNLPT